MGLNFDDIWANVLEILKKNFTQVSFNTWFGNTRIHDLNDNSVTLLVPMALHKKVMSTQYYDLISDAFAEVLNYECKIEFVLKKELGDNVKYVQNNVDVDNNKVMNKQKNEVNINSNLNKNLTFDNFVVGNSNKFAQTSSMEVAKEPGKFNPLFIYGKSGLGKTHLMHAIGNYVEEHHKNLKVLYATSDEFRKDYTSIANNKENSLEYANEFKNKYRTVDVLIIDDIQYLVGAERTQEEFFHIFNDLKNREKQIIISSDRSPEDLKVLENRLTSRFASGLPVDIYPPDFDLRCRIIRDKVKNLNIFEKLTDEAVEFIANNCDTDVRSIEGAINRLVAYTAMCVPDKIDMEFTNEALKDYITKNPYVTNDIITIQKAVANYYKLTIEVLKGKKRSANIAYPRMVAMYLCRLLTDQSFPRIGLEFGGRDHSTVIHACLKIEEDLKNNSQLKEIINEIKSNL